MMYMLCELKACARSSHYVPGTVAPQQLCFTPRKACINRIDQSEPTTPILPLPTLSSCLELDHCAADRARARDAGGKNRGWGGRRGQYGAQLRQGKYGYLAVASAMGRRRARGDRGQGIGDVLSVRYVRRLVRALYRMR